MFCIGLTRFLKRPFFGIATSSSFQLNIILDDTLKEAEKDKHLIKNLTKLLRYFMEGLVILLLLTLIAVFIPLLYLKVNNISEIDTSSVYFYACLVLGSLPLFAIKKKGDYSYWSKLLHTIVLDNYALGRYLFKRELKKKSKKVLSKNHDFLIITGLARSGTTALTNLIFDEKKFHSIKYSNVPFLLSPNLWRKIYRPRRVKLRERAHGDKVLFSEETLEALEEYFFKVFLRDSYIKENSLVQHQISEEIFLKYCQYQNLFKKSEGTVYLAKNNNFLLRYEGVRKLNKLFNMIVIFRDPVEHAKSLLKQHINFVRKQKEDYFVLTYMDWLGHHEFGLNQKHFSFINNDNFEEGNYDKCELSFWLRIWVNYYHHLTDIYTKGQKLFLVHYEDLALDPNSLKKSIAIHIGKELETTGYVKPFKINKYTTQYSSGVKDGLLEKAYEVYDKLLLNKIQLT